MSSINLYSEPPPPYPGDGKTSNNSAFVDPTSPYAPFNNSSFQQQQPVQQQPVRVHFQLPTSQPTQNVVFQTVSFSTRPTVMTCPYCNASIRTKVRGYPTCGAWLSCLIIGCFFWCGCCFIPFCMDSCKNFDHSCPHCNAMLGQYRGC